MITRKKSTHNEENPWFLILLLHLITKGMHRIPSTFNKYSMYFKFSHHYQIYAGSKLCLLELWGILLLKSILSSYIHINAGLKLMHQIMRRGQAIIHLLFLWLLLAAFQHHSIKTATKVQATRLGKTFLFPFYLSCIYIFIYAVLLYLM